VELLTIMLAAGETKRFEKAGSYFEVIGSSYAISVGFDGDKGSISDNLLGVLSGFFIEYSYKAFALTNGAAAQTVQVLLMERGRGGSRRQPGNVRIIDEITDACTSFSISAPGTVAASSWTQVVAPASNVNGIIIRSTQLTVQSGGGGSADFGFVAAKSLPTAYNVPAQRFECAYQFSGNGVLQSALDPHFNKLLPPGWGLYWHTNVAGVAAANVVGTIQIEIL
jgi:hypothetical protein